MSRCSNHMLSMWNLLAQWIMEEVCREMGTWSERVLVSALQVDRGEGIIPIFWDNAPIKLCKGRRGLSIGPNKGSPPKRNVDKGKSPNKIIKIIHIIQVAFTPLVLIKRNLVILKSPIKAKAPWNTKHVWYEYLERKEAGVTYDWAHKQKWYKIWVVRLVLLSSAI